jgi:hypothetical protein
MATTVAPLATLDGAADIALAISCLSLGAFFPCAAWAFIVNKKDAANIIKLHTTLFSSCIGVSSKSGGYYSYAIMVKLTAYVHFAFFRCFLYFFMFRFLLTSEKCKTRGKSLMLYGESHPASTRTKGQASVQRNAGSGAARS